MTLDLPPPPRIYVAASSKEIPRAQKAMRLVRELGAEVIGEWTEPIRLAGDSEGTRQTDAERALLSSEQLLYVSQADALVILIPDATQVEHIACGVERSREWAEYLHECGYGQWLDRLSEPGFEEPRRAA